MTETIEFIGLGVMGEPMCRNLARKSDRPVIAYDREKISAREAFGGGGAPDKSLTDLMAQADIVFLALPSGVHVQAVYDGASLTFNLAGIFGASLA